MIRASLCHLNKTTVSRSWPAQLPQCKCCAHSISYDLSTLHLVQLWVNWQCYSVHLWYNKVMVTFSVHAHMDARTHTHMHAHTHTRKHARTCTHTQAYGHSAGHRFTKSSSPVFTGTTNMAPHTEHSMQLQRLPVKQQRTTRTMSRLPRHAGQRGR